MRASIFLDGLADDIADRTEQRDLRRESRRMWDDTFDLSRQEALHEITHPLHGFQVMDPALNRKICEEAVGVVTLRRDNFALGRLMEYLAKWTFYAAESTGGDPATTIKMHQKALHYAEQADRYFRIVNYTSPTAGVLWVHSPYTEHFTRVAAHQADPEKRSLMEEKSLQSAPELVRLAAEKGSPRVLFYAYYQSSTAETSVAVRERNHRRRKSLLRKALAERLLAKQVTNQIFGSTSWNRGMLFRGLSEVQSKLAKIENDPKEKTTLLVEAIRSQEKWLSSSVSFVQALEPPRPHSFTVSIGLAYSAQGDLFLQLESVTADKNHVRKAGRSYLAAAEWYERIPRYDRSAECYWKTAQCYDSLLAYAVASEYFALGARAYQRFARVTPTLKDHARDYSQYLRAWNKIETARSEHIRKQFGLAADSYKRAAALHRTTKRWSFLAPYYTAFSKLESAERISNQGNHEAATEIFRQAALIFRGAKSSFKERLHQIERLDEVAIVQKLSTSSRDTYCEARISLEKALSTEAQQDYQTSFEEFGLASQKFNEIASMSESEEDRREAVFLAKLCNAWQAASEAELQGSIEPLQKARSLFRDAKAKAPNERSVQLAKGHEAFCEGMIASHQFSETLDPIFQEQASAHLELAYECYQEAGFSTAAHHAKARRLLMNASFLLNSMRNEFAQRKSNEIYGLADALLREATTEFRRAKQPLGREQARRLLRRNQTESRDSPKLGETIRALAHSSTNAAFNTPAQGEERADGIERFERSDIETNIVKLNTRVGTQNDLELELEISNTGRQPVRLLRLDEIVPEGADLVDHPEAWKKENHSISHSSRLLAPAKTENIRVVLRPKTEGLLKIRPKIVYIDDGGWRWERPMRPKIVPTSRIVEYLAFSYIKDNEKRSPPDQCGWKSMMQIVKELNIPRSHVYGPRRYGRIFGKQLNLLVKFSLVEYRIFPKERGRGGNITRVRIQTGNEIVREYLEEVSSHIGDPNALSAKGRLLADLSAS